MQSNTKYLNEQYTRWITTSNFDICKKFSYKYFKIQKHIPKFPRDIFSPPVGLFTYEQVLFFFWQGKKFYFVFPNRIKFIIHTNFSTGKNII